MIQDPGSWWILDLVLSFLSKDLGDPGRQIFNLPRDLEDLGSLNLCLSLDP